jgi:hypothetical protein
MFPKSWEKNSLLRIKSQCCFYFPEGKFQNDLNTDNVLGSGGKLAVCFAVLCKVLWSGKHFSYAPSKLKVCYIVFLQD